jgi:hypothetical protein
MIERPMVRFCSKDVTAAWRASLGLAGYGPRLIGSPKIMRFQSL